MLGSLSLAPFTMETGEGNPEGNPGARWVGLEGEVL